MKMLHTVMRGCLYYVYTFSDDDTITRKHLTHPETKPVGKKSIGGRLPKDILVPQWFFELAHRGKCSSRSLFELVKIVKSMK